jgi:hypothetical protein
MKPASHLYFTTIVGPWRYGIAGISWQSWAGTCLQEQNIKTGRFAMIYADEVIISHTNENEYNAFVNNKKNEALKDRMILMKVTTRQETPDGPTACRGFRSYTLSNCLLSYI